jgi:hypothetical protein
MIKIVHKTETEYLSNLPAEVVATIVEIATILDDNYGSTRDIVDLGGYIIVAEDKKDVETINKLIDFQYIVPEYVDLISCTNVENYTSTLLLLSSDYSISIIAPISLTPKELLKHMEE